MAQIIRITSEALQATVRRLLPSQQGFGEDLEATNVVTPIIDLTPAADGSQYRQDLQTALAFGSQTTFNVIGTTTTLANSSGFWRLKGSFLVTGPDGAQLELFDGSTAKIILKSAGSSSGEDIVTPFDLTVFLKSTESVRAVSSGLNATVNGSYRQIADSNGIFVNPAGFNPE